MGGDALNPEHLDASRGGLDRQRQAIEPPANLADQWRVCIARREILGDRAYVLDEQLHGWENRRPRRCSVNDMLAMSSSRSMRLFKRGDQAEKRLAGADLQVEHRRDRARYQTGIAERC